MPKYEPARMPVATVNRGLTVEILAKVAAHPSGRHAVPLLALLIWMRHVSGDEWLKVTSEIWRRRVGAPLKKRRATAALEELGMVTVRREGRQALQFKLAGGVDPRSQESKYRKKAAKGKGPGADAYDTPDMRESDAMIIDLFGGTEK